MLIVEHEADSGASLLGVAARRAGFTIDVATPTTGVPRSSAGYDIVMSLGSSASVNDGHIQHWFRDEVALLQDAHAREVPILGVCFGAQALAVALGGSVARAAKPEIGWFRVDTDRADLVENGPWFEWHVDAITPPPDATVVATTDAGVQAYVIGPHLGVQFHPEVTTTEVSAWAGAEGASLQQLGLRADKLVHETTTRADEAAARSNALFERFLQHAGLQQAVQ